MSELNAKKKYNGQIAFEIAINLVAYFLFISMLTSNIDTLVNEKLISNIYQKYAYIVATETELAVQNVKLREGLTMTIDYQNFFVEKINNKSIAINSTYPLAYAKIYENMTIDEFQGKGIINSWTISRT